MLGEAPRQAEVPAAAGLSACADSHVTFSIKTKQTGHSDGGKHAGHLQCQLWQCQATGHHNYMKGLHLLCADFIRWLILGI